MVSGIEKMQAALPTVTEGNQRPEAHEEVSEKRDSIVDLLNMSKPLGMLFMALLVLVGPEILGSMIDGTRSQVGAVSGLHADVKSSLIGLKPIELDAAADRFANLDPDQQRHYAGVLVGRVMDRYNAAEGGVDLRCDLQAMGLFDETDLDPDDPRAVRVGNSNLSFIALDDHELDDPERIVILANADADGDISDAVYAGESIQEAAERLKDLLDVKVARVANF